MALKQGDKIRLEKAEYALIQHIKSGGQADVWQVSRLSDAKMLALKVVSDIESSAKIEANIKRVANEIEFITQIPDPQAHYLISCIDKGILETAVYSLPMYVMPLCVEPLSYRDKFDSAERFLRWGWQLTTAVCWMHQYQPQGRPTIHRDLKPLNILIDPNEDLRVIDFGIIKNSNKTKTALALDENWCAPEQFFPTRPGKDKLSDQYSVTEKADIYNLGLTLYSMLLGDAAVPKAQAIYGTNGIREKHDRLIKTNDWGLIGTVGGLTSKEKNALLVVLSGLFKQNNNATLVHHGFSGLPNVSLICDLAVDFIESLLTALPEKRPSAKTVQQQFEFLDAAFKPSVTSMVWQSFPSTIRVNESVRFCFSVTGKGLTLADDWLLVELDRQALSQVELQADTSDQVVNGQRVFCFSWTASLKDEGSHQMRVLAKVNQTMIEIEQSFEVQISAKQLWQLGDYQQALMRDLREDWLEELARKVPNELSDKQWLELLIVLEKQHPNTSSIGSKLTQALWNAGHKEQALKRHLDESWLDTLEDNANTLKKRMDFVQLLQRLQTVHANNGLLQQRIERLENEEFGGDHISFNWKPWLAVTGLGALAYIGWGALNNPVKTLAEPDTSQLVEQKETPIAKTVPQTSISAPKPVEQTGVSALKPTLSTTPPAETPTKFYQQLSQWQSNNQLDKIKAQLPELKVKAQSGDGVAHLWLAWSAAQDITDVNQLLKAREYLHKAQQQGETGAKASLDQMDLYAESLLQSRLAEERHTGYRLIEQVAQQGDVNAMIWMAYRYEQGDGVDKNIPNALAWYKKASDLGDVIAKERLQQL